GQVPCLLRGPVGPERDLAVLHDVEHRDQVRRAVRVERGQLQLARPGEQGACLGGGDPGPGALLLWLYPMFSGASARASSQAKPARAPAAVFLKRGSKARCTDSGVHIPSADPCSEACTVARIRGGSMTAATPPCTTNTSPLTCSAAGLDRYTTSGATCSG